MNLKKINEIINNLSIITLKPFEFNRIHINVNCVLRAKHPKTWTNATHYHPWFEFKYVSKGSVYTTINGTEFLVSSGES